MSFFYAPTTHSTDRRRLRTVWRFLIFGVSFFGLQIALTIPLAIGVAVYLAATGELQPGNPDELARMLESRLNDSMMELQLIAALPIALGSMLLCAFCRRYLDRRPVVSMGLLRPQSPVFGIVAGFLLGLAPILAAAAIVYLLGGYSFDGFSATWMTAAAVPALVLMAFHEEIVFRGYLLQNLLDIRRGSFGVLFTSATFWLVHGANPAAWQSPFSSVNLFGAGILLALAYRLSGNIWFPTALHFAWNFAQGVVLSIPVSGLKFDGVVRLAPTGNVPEWVTGGDFGLEGSAVTTGAEVALIVLFICLIKARRPDELAGSAPAELDDAAFVDPPSTGIDSSTNGESDNS